MKIKVLLQLLAVLCIGFVLGFLTNSSITSKKLQNYSWRRGEVTFWSKALDEVGATLEQKDKIMPIVVSYSDKSHNTMRDAFRRIEPLWDEMEKEIAPLLTDEQKMKLDEMQKKRIEKFRDRTKGPSQGGGWNRDGEHKGNNPPPRP
jgi:hypothetical protein